MLVVIFHADSKSCRSPEAFCSCTPLGFTQDPDTGVTPSSNQRTCFPTAGIALTGATVGRLTLIELVRPQQVRVGVRGGPRAVRTFLTSCSSGATAAVSARWRRGGRMRSLLAGRSEYPGW